MKKYLIRNIVSQENLTYSSKRRVNKISFAHTSRCLFCGIWVAKGESCYEFTFVAHKAVHPALKGMKMINHLCAKCNYRNEQSDIRYNKWVSDHLMGVYTYNARGIEELYKSAEPVLPRYIVVEKPHEYRMQIREYLIPYNEFSCVDNKETTLPVSVVAIYECKNTASQNGIEYDIYEYRGIEK